MQHDHGVVAAREPATPGVVAPAGVEEVRVHAASPQGGMREPAPDQIVTHRLPRREGHAGRTVKPPQPAPHQRLEESDAVVSAVFWKVRVEGGDQRHSSPQRPTASGEPQRALGVQVHEIRRRGVEEIGDLAEGRQRQADVRVQREGERWDAQLAQVRRRGAGRVRGATTRVSWPCARSSETMRRTTVVTPLTCGV